VKLARGAGGGSGGQLRARAAAPKGGDGDQLNVRVAAPRGSGGGGDGGMRVFSVCGCFKLRQRKEGKRSMGHMGPTVYIHRLLMNICGRFVG
jgi:hypothetical protein